MVLFTLTALMERHLRSRAGAGARAPTSGFALIVGQMPVIYSGAGRPRSRHLSSLSLQAASAYPVLVSGQRAYKTIRGIADDTGAEALDDHMDRAEKTIGLFYVLALVALAGLLVPIKWPKTGLPLTATTLVFALVCFGLSRYIA
jgi:hypothetical protein